MTQSSDPAQEAGSIMGSEIGSGNGGGGPSSANAKDQADRAKAAANAACAARSSALDQARAAHGQALDNAVFDQSRMDSQSIGSPSTPQEAAANFQAAEAVADANLKAAEEAAEANFKAAQDRLAAENFEAKQNFENSLTSVAKSSPAEAATLSALSVAQPGAVKAMPAATVSMETMCGFAQPGTFDDSYFAQTMSGINEGMANVIGAPVDLVEAGLNLVSAGARFAGVPDEWTPEFENSLGGSQSIKAGLGYLGALALPSADPAKQRLRSNAATGVEVASMAVGGVSMARRVTVGAAPAAGTIVTYSRPASVDIHLSYMRQWNAAQRAAADEKVYSLTRADTVVISRPRPPSAKAKFVGEVDDVPIGYDVDHVHDWQLGGTNDVWNLALLDRSVNRSLGAQIQAQIRTRGLEPGTRIERFTIGDRQ